MKLKLLSIFFVVLIAQTQVAQGTPLGLSLELGGFLGAATNLVAGAVSTITNSLHGILSLLSNVLNDRAIGSAADRATADIHIAFAAIGQLGAVPAGTPVDPVATGSAYLSGAASNILPIIEDILEPLSDFNTALSNFIGNTAALLSNPIDNINQNIVGLSSLLNTVDLFQTGMGITFQGAGIVGNILEPVAVPIGTAIAQIGTSVPAATSTGFSALNAGPLNIDNVLDTASSLTNALAAQVVAGTQSLTASVVPITTELSTPVNNIAEAVSSVPAKINGAITAINDVETAFLAVSIARRQEIVAAISALDTACANEAATNIHDKSEVIQADATTCITNEIPTLQNYLAQYQDNAAQYQAGITANTLSIATLKQTVQNSIAFKLHLISAKVRVEGCLTNKLLNFSAALLPLAAYGITCNA